MPRYFYKHPLEAAWMMAAHGVIIEDFSYRFAHHSCSAGLASMEGCWSFEVIDSMVADYRFYIHPNSLRLLEPQLGDVCDVLDNGVRLVQWVTDTLDLCEFAVGTWQLQAVIQRGGKPFFWPVSG